MNRARKAVGNGTLMLLDEKRSMTGTGSDPLLGSTLNQCGLRRSENLLADRQNAFWCREGKNPMLRTHILRGEQRPTQPHTRQKPRLWLMQGTQGQEST